MYCGGIKAAIDTAAGEAPEFDDRLNQLLRQGLTRSQDRRSLYVSAPVSALTKGSEIVASYGWFLSVRLRTTSRTLLQALQEFAAFATIADG
ncbi:hypothetical protein [Rhabdochromatium marinum]|uniref:hypothetical protein n=1 Tax=Rhabdochromatium marinum TaxID=48729 RepID=UPI00190450E5|nr:hypothetical protein [Rhabdochromatium marinum]MBK1649466.1 hypothetical protein [Rhabdochromatium marinum]